MRLCSEDKHHLRKSADRKAQIRKAFVPLTGLICASRSADFFKWCLFSERNLTHNLFFLFPMVFFDEKKDGVAGNSIVCSMLRSPVTPFHRGKTIAKSASLRAVSKSATFWATEKCELSAI